MLREAEPADLIGEKLKWIGRLSHDKDALITLVTESDMVVILQPSGKFLAGIPTAVLERIEELVNCNPTSTGEGGDTNERRN